MLQREWTWCNYHHVNQCLDGTAWFQLSDGPPFASLSEYFYALLCCWVFGTVCTRCANALFAQSECVEPFTVIFTVVYQRGEPSANISPKILYNSGLPSWSPGQFLKCWYLHRYIQLIPEVYTQLSQIHLNSVFHNSWHLILIKIPCLRSVRITTLFEECEMSE